MSHFQRLILLLTAAMMAGASANAAEPLPAPKLNGNTITIGRQQIQVAPSGLPAQITIAPTASEIPLLRRSGDDILRRGADAPLTAGELVAMGRGELLRNPIRLVADIGGTATEAEVSKAAELQEKGDTVQGSSTVKFEGVETQLNVVYGRAGNLDVTVQLGGTGEVQRVSLRVEPAGLVDTVVAGEVVADKPQVHEREAYLIADKENAWQSTQAVDPGLVQHIFVGSGDRGWTLLAKPEGGWQLAGDKPGAELLRDDAGNLNWLQHLVNKPTEMPVKEAMSFTLLTHPLREKPANHRRTAWLSWPQGQAETPAPTAGAIAKGGVPNMLRADVAVPFEGLATHTVLSGPAGAAALGPEQPLADVYPQPLFRYLAACHTGYVGRLVPNGRSVIRPGQFDGVDRLALGRALLHDIGADLEGIAHLASAVNVVKKLHEHDFFADDGKTEVMPYWRADRGIRFGQEWDSGDQCALTADNPLARVYMTVYRRPREGGKYTDVLVVIVNEGPQAVREQLYVTDPKALFGGGNIQSPKEISESYDFSNHPNPIDDWSKRNVQWRVGGRHNRLGFRDIEDSGIVAVASVEGGIENYGPNVYVGPRDFRILYAKGGKRQR